MSTVELIIGMSLMVLLVGLSIPKVDTGYAKTKWERRKFCSEIRLTKRKNLSGKSESIRVTNKNGNSYYIIQKGLNIEKIVEIPNKIKLYSSMDSISFKEDGRPYESGIVDFQYREKIYQITITPISGRILFKEDIYENEK